MTRHLSRRTVFRKLGPLGLLAGLIAPACIAPSVLETEDRAVALVTENFEWRAASAEDLQGLFGSVEITGPAAAALSKLYYWFEEDGSYSGAALFAGHPAHFETLSGTWSLEGETLTLDDSEPARLSATDEALRLEGAEGAVILVREEAH